MSPPSLFLAVELATADARFITEPWWDVEEQVTRGPTKAWPVFGALVAGVKAKVNSLLGEPLSSLIEP